MPNLQKIDFIYTSILSLILIILFASFLFNMKKSYPKIYIFINIMLFLPFVSIALYLYSLFIVDIKDYFGNYGSYLTFFILLSLSCIGIYMLIKKEIGAKYYLIGHGTFLLALFVNSLGLYGIITYYEALKLLIPIALWVDVLFLLVAQYLKTYKAQLELLKNRELLLEQSRFISIGQAIGNIAHQWRQPLAIVGISVGILREKKLCNRLKDKEFEEELSHIDRNILHMSQTIEDFLSYFRPNKTKEDFYISEAVDKSLLIIGNLIYKEDINIVVNIDKAYQVYGFKEEYVQVLISIISNAIYALKDKDKKSVNIDSLCRDGIYTLEIRDNGGGISEDLIDKIFEPYFTTKDQSIGTGLGLYIAKTIIENSMNGRLKVVNTQEGAKFSIII